LTLLLIIVDKHPFQERRAELFHYRKGDHLPFILLGIKQEKVGLE